MAFQIGWTIEGEKQLSRRLLIVSDHVKDFSPAFKQSVELLKEVFSTEVFETEGGVIQEHWSPLKKAYAVQKAKRYPGKGILEATGKMRNSFQTMYTTDVGVISNDSEYFKYHQSNKPRDVLPRRVIMKIGDRQKTEIVRIFQQHIRQALTV